MRLARAVEFDAAGPEIGEDGGHQALLPIDADARMREVFAGLPHRIGAFPGRGSPVKMAASAAGTSPATNRKVTGSGRRSEVANVSHSSRVTMRCSFRASARLAPIHGARSIRCKVTRLAARPEG